MRRATSKGIEMIKSLEGYSSHAYKCSDNESFYTIGYGHYGIKNPNTVIDEATANTLLEEDLVECYTHLERYDKIYKFTDYEYDAMVSFCFNLGSITQLTNDGQRSKWEVANSMLKYVTDGVQTLEGLVRRREIEHNLFVNGVYPNDTPFENVNADVKTIDENTTCGELVDMILNGDMGNGDMRKEKLYDIIQSMVNHRLGVE